MKVKLRDIPHLVYPLIVSCFLIFGCSRNSRYCKVVNAGISGNNSQELFERMQKYFPIPSPDIAIIMVGTNDMLNTSKMLTYSDFEHHLKLLVACFQRKGSKVILISPPPVDPIYLFERHDSEAFSAPPNVKLDSIRKIMQHMSKDFKIDFIDIYSEFKQKGIPVHNYDRFIQNLHNSGQRDGVHPTAAGNKLMANKIADFLIQQGLCESSCYVYCLGDSITYGKGLQGAGTTNGETYPAYLKKKMNK